MGNTVDRYKILNEISSVISQSLDLEEILCSALEQVLLAADLDTGGIYLFDEKSKLLKVAAHHGFEPDFIKEIDNLKYGEGFSGLVMEKGQPLVIRDISQEKRLSRSIVNEAGLTSLVVVPVCSKQKTLGTLFLISHDLRDFDDQEVQRTFYRAHGGADAWMIITAPDLRGMDFLAHAVLSPGHMIEAHIDPYEEIYFILEGQGLIRVGDEEKPVRPMDATYLPAGVPHALTNTGASDLKILVVAAPPVRDMRDY